LISSESVNAPKIQSPGFSDYVTLPFTHAKMKFPMQRLTIAVTGDFGPKRSHEKMEHWVKKNGGTFSKDINKTVTHLVCSKEEYKKNSAMGIVSRSPVMVGSLTLRQ